LNEEAREQNASSQTGGLPAFTTEVFRFGVLDLDLLLQKASSM
jgi:hypothetical protein